MIKKLGLKKNHIQRITLAHKALFAISLGLYIVLSVIFSPEFMLSDMRHKFSALADDTIELTAKVLGPPTKPIVSGTAICTAKKLSVKLSWPADENSETFSIQRDSVLLATGITNSSYEDSDVNSNTSHDYIVTAHGSMGPGSVDSNPITITTPSDCIVPQPPFTEKITTLEQKDLASYGANPQIEARQPTFAGQTNIANAKINITLDGGPTIYATIYANINGFWSWQSPIEIDINPHTLYVTATYPDDATITASDSLTFEIVANKKATSSKKTHATTPTETIPTSNQTTTTTPKPASFEMIASVENQEHTLTAGSDLMLHIDFSQKSDALENKDYEIFYDIIDPDNNLISQTSEKINISQQRSHSKKLPVAGLIRSGEYRILVRTYDGANLISSTTHFHVKGVPVLSLGSTNVSFADMLQGLSWFSIFLFFFFLIFLNLERYLSNQSDFHITENYLKKKGFFTTRKEVDR